MTKYKLVLFTFHIFFICPVLLFAQTTSYEHGSFILKHDTLPYRVLFPKNFKSDKLYPVIIVLHGAGERGNDNEAELKYGADLFLRDSIRKKYPAIVIFPQCATNSYWSNVKIETDSVAKKSKFIFLADKPPTKAMQLLLGLVDNFLEKPYVNKSKIYIGGLSMGGMGTYEIIGRKPDVFAAALAICGGDNTLNVRKYANKVPLWIFHGKKDDIVPYFHSEAIVATLRAVGANPKYTLYPNDFHNSWNDAFAEPNLLPWLLSNDNLNLKDSQKSK